jgi:hypothetical protein
MEVVVMQVLVVLVGQEVELLVEVREVLQVQEILPQ